MIWSCVAEYRKNELSKFPFGNSEVAQKKRASRLSFLFHRKMRPMNFISHQTTHTFSRGSTQGQMISGFLVAGAAQRTALVMTF